MIFFLSLTLQNVFLNFSPRVNSKGSIKNGAGPILAANSTYIKKLTLQTVNRLALDRYIYAK